MEIPEDGGDNRLTVVIWTEEGQNSFAQSEHGQHKAGDEVETEHAEMLIERGFAKAKE